VKAVPNRDPVINQAERSGSHQTSGDFLDSLLDSGYELKDNRDLAAVLRDVLSRAIRSVGADGGFILVLDEGGWASHWFVFRDGEGKFVPATHMRNIVERGIVGWVIQHQRGQVVSDLANDPRWFHLPHYPVSSGQGAALCLPLLVQNRVVGAVVLIHPTPGHFEPRHLIMLQGIAGQAALSVENARLYETVRRRAEEMAALSEMALNISADQPLDRLLDTVVAQAMDLLRCQGGGVFMWQKEAARLELVAAYDPEIDLRGTRIIPGEGLAGRAFEIGDLLTQDEYKLLSDAAPGSSDSVISSGLPAATAIAVPLVWQGQRLGVLVCTDRTLGREFGHSDRHLLTLLANQAAATIASVKLHEKNSHRLQELMFLNQTIQDITVTLDLDEIFGILTRRVMDLLGIEACSIALVDRETNELVFSMASGGGADTVVGERVPWGQGIVGAAAQLGEPVSVSDVAQDVRFYKEIDEKQTEFITQSILAVPMISRGQVVGVVEGLNKPGGFNAEDERLLNALASLAASVVENANLVSAQRELDTLRENLTNMIVHDLRSPVGTISNSLQLLSRLVGDAESDQAVQLVDIAARATQRLMNLVDSLLDISRLEAGQELTDRHPVSIKVLIQSAVDQLALYAQRKQMRLIVQYPDHLPVILADGGMIERVLVNLINNALKFTPSGGEVSIAVEVDGDFLYVRVRDTGPGILPEHRGQIFDKFARVRDREGMGGFGLGLAFCRLAVEAHGGEIWVEGADGQGSTFVFTLPLSKGRNGSAAPVRS
jgi:NtrC-family two-component system sensor histidine kinase KinB